LTIHANSSKAYEVYGTYGRASILTLGGRFGDYPPTDDDGFLAFAKSLHTPKLYEIVKDAERVSEFTHHRFPSSLPRHYERLMDFPEGFVVLGDALASFNPVYAQGMSSAALQAEVLQFELKKRTKEATWLEGFAPAFFTRVAEVVSTPWMLAANSDFAYPQTRGERRRLHHMRVARRKLTQTDFNSMLKV
jgi:2-polyprenyl-6-methoxyphenol hydroxylase-like FAD-dependent oxidoreductase